jgi:hypothetical protein
MMRFFFVVQVGGLIKLTFVVMFVSAHLLVAALVYRQACLFSSRSFRRIDLASFLHPLFSACWLATAQWASSPAVTSLNGSFLPACGPPRSLPGTDVNFVERQRRRRRTEASRRRNCQWQVQGVTRDDRSALKRFNTSFSFSY